MKSLTVKEMIEKLQELPMDEEVVLFGEGKIFPCLVINRLQFGEGHHIEIAGGWNPLEEN